MPPLTETPTRAHWRLADWLAYQERLHPRAIELGLERVAEVAQRLGLLPARSITLTVAGTNGKGSSATLAAEIYRAAGYHVGRYLSPHLLRYNERIAIDGSEVDDASLCSAFCAVDRARGSTPLTYFEFGTLAALWLFRRAKVDVQVLEVGLGGRLDAVNVIDADCALVTNIGLDHLDWLGRDRESIGREKAGIFRAGKPAICAQVDAPSTVSGTAHGLGARWLQAGEAFRYEVFADSAHWDWRGTRLSYEALPRPGLYGRAQFANSAGVLAAIETLQAQLPVPESAIRAALPKLALRGRYERRGDLILDVAHNAEAAEVLAENLREDGLQGCVHLVLGMLSDKPVEAVCRVLAPLARSLRFVSLPPPRGLSAEVLAQRAATVGVEGTVCNGGLPRALAEAQAACGKGEVVLVCGSFLSVAAAEQSI